MLQGCNCLGQAVLQGRFCKKCTGQIGSAAGAQPGIDMQFKLALQNRVSRIQL